MKKANIKQPNAVIPAQAGILAISKKDSRLRGNDNIIRLIAVTLLFLSTPAHAQQVQYFNVHSGTGFFVNRDYLITNAHVVKGCTKVTIGGAVPSQEAQVTAVDEEHDLALIRSNAQPSEFAPLRLEIDTIKPGDEVTLIGYPGEKGAAGEYTVTTAKVEKLDLDRLGNPWRFYISDVIKQGNSGGPVLDSSGNVIGVAEGMIQLKTINATTQEKISEERMGMVITLRTLQQFLQNQGVFAQWGGSGLLTFAEGILVDRAKNYTVNVQCRVETDAPSAQQEQQWP